MWGYGKNIWQREGLIEKGTLRGRGSLIQDLQYHEFYLEEGKGIIITYYVLVLRMFPFYDQRFWGLHNIDRPPLPAWDKSNWHKLKEPLKTVWNISLLGGWVGGL